MSEYIVSVPDERVEEFRTYIESKQATLFGFKLGSEIVRCSDCKHADHYHPLDYRTGRPHETLEVWHCTWHSNPEGASEIDPDGFCKWGGRRDDE